MRQHIRQNKNRSKKRLISKKNIPQACQRNSIRNIKFNEPQQKKIQNIPKKFYHRVIVWPDQDDLERFQQRPAQLTEMEQINELVEKCPKTLENFQALKYFCIEKLYEEKAYENHKHCSHLQPKDHSNVIQKILPTIILAQNSQNCQLKEVSQIRVQKSPEVLQNVYVDEKQYHAIKSTIQTYVPPNQPDQMIDQSGHAFQQFAFCSHQIQPEKQHFPAIQIGIQAKQSSIKQHENSYQQIKLLLPSANPKKHQNTNCHQPLNSVQCIDDAHFNKHESKKKLYKSKSPHKSKQTKKSSATFREYVCHCNSRNCRDQYCGCHRMGRRCSDMCYCVDCNNYPKQKYPNKLEKSHALSKLDMLNEIEEDLEFGIEFQAVNFFGLEEVNIEQRVEFISLTQAQGNQQEKREASILGADVFSVNPDQSIWQISNEIKEILQENQSLQYQYHNTNIT